MCLPRTHRIWFLFFFVATSLWLLLLSGWALWPHWREHNIHTALVSSTGPCLWWPESWRKQFAAARALIDGAEQKRGVSEWKADWFFQPSQRTSDGASLNGLIEEVKMASASRVVVDPLVAVLADERRHPSVRLVAAYSLGELAADGTAAVSTLTDVLTKTRNPVPDAAGRVLSEAEAASLFQAGRLRAYAAMALGKIGPRASSAASALASAAAEEPTWYSLTQSCAEAALQKIAPEVARCSGPSETAD
jgi:hypothetical protein